MAKNNRSFSAIHWFIAMLCLVGPYYGAANNTSIRKNLTAIYTSQIGVCEATGKNDGPQIKAYLKVTGLPEGYPWCAAYLAWCFKEAGINACKSAYSPAWFPKNRITNKPLPGDVIGIYFRKLKRIAHVGFWHQDAGAFVITVEGNTNDEGSREGNRVAKRRRLKKQIHSISNWIK